MMSGAFLFLPCGKSKGVLMAFRSGGGGPSAKDLAVG